MTRFTFETTAAERQRAEHIVAQAFARCYGASTTSPFPALAALYDGDAIVATAGHRAAADGPLFLEAYLDQPVEAALAGALGRPVSRDGIVEIGALSAGGRTPLISLFAALARALDEQGFDTAVVTATARLRRAFDRIGFATVPLAVADPARLPGNTARWGSYYAAAPMVVAGPIRATRERLERLASRGQLTIGAAA